MTTIAPEKCGTNISRHSSISRTLEPFEGEDDRDNDLNYWQ